MTESRQIDLLIVDDDDDYRQTLSSRFTRQGFRVREAADAEQALDLAERQEFDVSQTIYSARELKGLLEHCGFKSTKAFGNFEGAPYDQKAKRLVVVGSK